MKSRKVAIIGMGRYGRFWREFFEKRGCEVRVSDIATIPSNKEIARWGEVVLISVTLLETVDVFRSLIPLLRSDQLLVDIASTKTKSVAAMLESSAEVLGLHPFCAPPKRATFKGQTMFVRRARLSAWKDWVEGFLAATEARIEEIVSEQHDLERTVDQMIEHMCTLLKAKVMQRLGLDPSRLFRVASPVYKLSAVQMARMFAQSPDLYGGLAMSNPFTVETLRIFAEEFGQYRDTIAKEDMRAYCANFIGCASFIGRENTRDMFALSEHLVGFMADLVEPNTMRISLENNGSGTLEKVLVPFREAGINLTALHSRLAGNRVEFFIAFDAANDGAIAEVRRRLADELNATFI